MNALPALLHRLARRVRRWPALLVGLAAVSMLHLGAHAATVYTYDELNRLTKVAYDDGRSISYAYDPAGNLLEVRRAGGPGPIAGLVGQWAFDACDARDSGANGLNGTISGAPQCVSGRFGKALRFNGASDWITVPSSAKFPQVGLTHSYWLHREGKSPALYALQNYLSKEGSFQSYLFPSGGMTSGLFLSGQGGWNQYGDAVLIPTLTDWVHYAFTFDNATRTAKTYVNGVLRETVVDSNPAAQLGPSGQPLFIGRNGSANVYHIVGLLDDVRIYDRALTDAEVARVFNGEGGP